MKIRPVWIAAGALLAVALVGWGLGSEFDSDSSPAFGFSPRNGEQLEYAFESTMEGWASTETLRLAILGRQAAAAAGERMELAARFHGRLRLEFSASTSADTTWRVDARLLDARAEVNGGLFVDDVELAVPFRFSLSSQGIVGAFEFEDGVSDRCRTACRSIVQGFQVVLPEDPAATWHARESNLEGEYAVAYQVQSQPTPDGMWHVRKTWLSHIPAPQTDTSNLTATREIRSSEGEVDFRSGDPWLEATRWSLSLRDKSKGAVFAAYRTAFRAERVPLGPEPAAIASRGRRPAPGTVDAGTDARFAHNVEPEDPVDVPVMDVADIVSRFVSSVDGDYVTARDTLLEYLRVYPEAAGELARYLDRHGAELEQKYELALWRMIAQADTAESQRALAEVLNASNYEQRSRLNALFHMMDIPSPKPFVIEDLWRFHDETAGSPDPTTDQMSTTAVLVIGALGHSDHGDPELAAQIGSQLGHRLSQAEDSADRGVLLEAVGNLGDIRTLPDVLSRLQDPDLDVRAAAYRSMRRMQEPEASEAIIRAYATEQNITVRTTAVTTLAGMPGREEVVTWARDEIRRASEPMIQAALVHLLGSNLEEFPEGGASLRELLDRRPAREVRREIYRFAPLDTTLRPR